MDPIRDTLGNRVSRGRLSRRGLLAAGASAAAGVALSRTPAGAQTAEECVPPDPDDRLTDEVGTNLPPSRIGCQLYSVANQVSAIGWGKLLAALKEIGYRSVEFAGFSGATPAQLKTMLDDLGMRAVGNHGAMDQASINAAVALGLPYTGISLITNIYGAHTDAWKRTAAEFNAFGTLAAAEGVKFYVHMHPEPYTPVIDAPGKYALDILLANTDPALVFFEMDIYWAYYAAYTEGGGLLFDPVNWVLANPARFPIFHVKDGRKAARQTAGGQTATLMYSPFGAPPTGEGISDVGQGDIDFKAFFGRVAQVRELKTVDLMWERDTASSHPHGSLASARASYLMMRYDHMAGPSRY